MNFIPYKSLFFLILISLSFVIENFGQILTEGTRPMALGFFQTGERTNAASTNQYFLSNGQFICLNFIDEQMGDELGVIKDGRFELIDIDLGIQSSNPLNFVSVDDEIYFTALHSENGGVIWKTDGTEEGTSVFLDPDPENASNTRPQGLTALGDLEFIFSFSGNLYHFENGQNEIVDSGVNLGVENFTKYKNGIAYWKASPNSVYGLQLMYFDGEEVSVLHETESIFNGATVYNTHAIGDQIYSLYELGFDGLTHLYVQNSSGHEQLMLDSLNRFSRRFINGENYFIGFVFDMSEIFSEDRLVEQLTVFSDSASSIEIIEEDFISNYAQGQFNHHASVENSLVFELNRRVFSGQFSSSRYKQVFFTNGTSDGTSLLFDELSISSNIVSDQDQYYHAGAVQDFREPEIMKIHAINQQTGDIEELESFERKDLPGISGFTDYFELLGTVDNKLYYLLATDYVDNEAVYSIHEISINSNTTTSTEEYEELDKFAVLLVENQIKVITDANVNEVNLSIYSTNGQQLYYNMIKTNRFYRIEDIDFNQPLIFRILDDNSISIHKVYSVD